jgi:hypothetical protein
MSSICDTVVPMTRGTYLNVFGGMGGGGVEEDVTADVIRDALAARSNAQLYSKLGVTVASSAMEIAYRLYNDWDDNDRVLGSIRSRKGVPHAYHPVVGRWVPILSKFGDVPDLSYWLAKNATTSSKAREDFYLAWKDMPRSARICNPYSYYPCEVGGAGVGGCQRGRGGEGCSVRIGNFNNNMSEADLVLILSTYGPIIDVYRPAHTKRNVYMSSEHIQKCKKAFYLFVEFADAAAAAALCEDIHRVCDQSQAQQSQAQQSQAQQSQAQQSQAQQSVYFMNFPISIGLAKSRPGPPVFVA